MKNDCCYSQTRLAEFDLSKIEIVFPKGQPFKADMKTMLRVTKQHNEQVPKANKIREQWKVKPQHQIKKIVAIDQENNILQETEL